MQEKISPKYTNKLFWKNKNILITGINGFIGGNLTKKLVSLGANVVGITNDRKKDNFLVFENLIDKINYHYVDISDYEEVKKIIISNNIQICFHMAAQVDVNVAKIKPHLTFENNIKGTYNLLEALRLSKTIKSIIVASSDKAYGEYKLKDLPYLEDYDLRPLYPYDVSKACADLITKSYSTSLFNLPVVTTRFSNIYGPGQLNLTALIPDCILANLKLRKFIPRGNGKNKRDFLYVDDVVDLYLCLAFNLFKDKKLAGEIFNAGTGKGYTVNEITKNICLLKNNQKLYQNIKKSYVGKKLTGEIQHQFMSYAKLEKMFNWKPNHNIKEGLSITIDWYERFLAKYNYKKFL
tara:strand:- start:14097 stop:15149 length:1053 start_codon:yes stop_codon:yes gene_type:complete